MGVTLNERSSDDKKAEKDADGWDVKFDSSDVADWSSLTLPQKLMAVGSVLFKVTVICGALYFFICSLSFLADGFRLVAGRQAGEVFRDSDMFNNPVAGFLTGVLVTVLVQSSSTSTSIVITMVAAELFTVRQAIPLVMGANCGTSVTSTIVALAQTGDKNDFKRAFAAATVHDMFNFLTVAVLLPLESISGFLNGLSHWLIQQTPGLESGEDPPDMLRLLTDPLTDEIIDINSGLIRDSARARTAEERAELEGERMFVFFFGWGPNDLSDFGAGILVLAFALTILCVTLYLIVFTLKSLLKGRIAVWLHWAANGDVPDLKIGETTIPLGWISGYLAIGVGVGVTIAVQSSSITTSALTPLVGIGVIKLERMYPLVLGANIGTCVTGVLAALSASASRLYLTLQVAYAHLLFNITGILIFYVVWPLRTLPISAAKYLGQMTSRYPWFAIAYLCVAFLLIPLIFMGLAFWGVAALITVIVLVLLTAAFFLAVYLMQKHYPDHLPENLRTWEFLPAWLRSLEPLDHVVCAPLGNFLNRNCRPCKPKKSAAPTAAASSSTTSSSNNVEINQHAV